MWPSKIKPNEAKSKHAVLAQQNGKKAQQSLINMI
jgi:hypothetical protein